MAEDGSNPTELLRQHEALRRHTIDLVQTARTIMSDGTGFLVASALRLAEALTEHQRLEDDVLVTLMSASDRASSMHIGEMLAGHREEHCAFLGELRLVVGSDEPSIDLEAQVFELAAAIHRHMDREEVEYLNAGVASESLPGCRRA
jgi:hypothetical protein